METFAYLASSTLPMAVLAFVGSYFGIWKRNEHKLPASEAIILFFVLWVISAILIILFKIMLAGQGELTQSTVGNLWGPLIVGIIIGRIIADWRRKVNAKKKLEKQIENI
ncbi:hypothetical protein TspCOW1_12690 [Thiohalobacter sp. COW1]|uniref:hypothetical protein n=1 Tax=Thiohalobacter sp. COW1 TaxID=2795687 RepID=UPI001915380B|nr:hypothetical protein [Thiohalobacter sp. COW1]BCO31166.1 hypothetical protein TspCOW1_12690 [Thiohalobacter sp. COW1]